MNKFLWAMGSAGVVSLISLMGIATLPFSEEGLRRIIFILISLATGALFGDAILHLLPAIFKSDANPLKSSLLVLTGIFLSFVFEKFLRWKDHHGLEGSTKIKPVGRIILVSDGLHNLVDGILIGASYLADRNVGVATTLAVALHELPHELGDFGVLVDSGYSRGRALLFNFLCACISLAGVLVAFCFQSIIGDLPRIALPLTAGSFLYIAGSNLTPELQKESAPMKSLLQCLGMLAGAGLMVLLLFME